MLCVPCVYQYLLQYEYGVVRTESSTTDPPPNYWKRYVNDTHIIPEQGISTWLHRHTSTVLMKNIKWTSEGEEITVLQEDTARSLLESSSKNPTLIGVSTLKVTTHQNKRKFLDP